MENQIEKKLIYQNEQNVQIIKEMPEKSRPYVQAIIDAYRTIEGLPPLDTATLHAINNDFEVFKMEANKQYYAAIFAESHKPLGISETTGMLLVADKFPDYSGLYLVLKQFQEKAYQSYSGMLGIEQFNIDEAGELKHDEEYIERAIYGEGIYIETDQEAEFVEAAQSIIDSLLKINKILPHGVDGFTLNRPSVGTPDLGILSQFINVRYPHNQLTPEIEFKPEFIRKMKNKIY